MDADDAALAGDRAAARVREREREREKEREREREVEVERKSTKARLSFARFFQSSAFSIARMLHADDLISIGFS